MYIYIFEYLGQVSNNYHCGGGLVVVAKDNREARKLIEREPHVDVTEDEWKDVIRYRLGGDEESRLFVFQDAGCC